MIYKISLIEFSPSPTTTSSSTTTIDSLKTKSTSSSTMKRKRNKIEKEYSMKMTRIETKFQNCCKLLPYETLFNDPNNNIVNNNHQQKMIINSHLPQMNPNNYANRIFATNNVNSHYHIDNSISPLLHDQYNNAEECVLKPLLLKSMNLNNSQSDKSATPIKQEIVTNDNHPKPSYIRKTFRSSISIKELLN